MSIHTVFGIAAGILSVAAYPIYIRDIIRGNTRPSRITWWVLMLSNLLIAASYFASGARDTIWIPISYSIGFFVIAVISIRYGEGGWTMLDKLSIFGVIGGTLLWYFYGSPQIALLAIVCVEFFGLIPTMYKAYKRPWTEDKNAWLIASAASFINLLAIETWDYSVSIYPFYVFITNSIIAYGLVRGRSKSDDHATIP